MWKQAIDDEMALMQSHSVWKLGTPTERRVDITSEVGAFTLKRDLNGEIVCYKARLVAKGSVQVEKSDFRGSACPGEEAHYHICFVGK